MSDVATQKHIKIGIDISEEGAFALAQFVKRVGWDEFRANAADVEEAELIRYGVERLQDALANAGYAPR